LFISGVRLLKKVRFELSFVCIFTSFAYIWNRKYVIKQNYPLFIILQDNTVIKVEIDVDILSEEESIDLKSDEVYASSLSSFPVKTEPKVSFVFRYFCGCCTSMHCYLFWYAICNMMSNSESVHTPAVCLSGTLSASLWFFLCSAPVRTGQNITVWISIVYIRWFILRGLWDHLAVFVTPSPHLCCC
jgi:hypothetical protein